MIHLNPTEWEPIAAAGSGVLFRKSECECRSCLYGNREHPPAEFVEAAAACETCEGKPWVEKRYWAASDPRAKTAKRIGWPFTDNQFDVIPSRCPDCLGGKRRVAVVVPCPGPPYHGFHGPGHDACSGFVTVGHVVVTWGPLVVVETITEGEPCLVLMDGGYDWKGKKPPVLYRYRPGTGLSMEQVTLPPDTDPATLVDQYAIGVEVVS